ncbi:MerR family transcriptional regulator [Streptomonospora nanhaiensis]|uniref:DNA-binding transcriptional MerR regulator n=1 Tax=Streptomonospora nanhaiensis TaxID=1323731 RepID=A0A853BF40_9ACTN|nr:MerR family transcriptional regulator [Streptomonospora nanhaiensis]MBV2366134.1 MerR family transcriptional regulator [Streptomonospora nanhaiensis]MBX9390225.1 MerR family transcriptional regulator [Streptomonospora nanhaiensis]NYI93889.1 DNA-binding transcriptional MerR regulator [Streptomonospora nanhaiensis]
MSEYYTPGEVAERFGLSLDTLRYYEREGLLTEVERSTSGHRRYRAADVELLGLVRCLRDTGMPIARLRGFAELVRAGDSTIPGRLEVLREHAERVAEQMVELRRTQEAIEHKIAYYEGVLAVRDASPADAGTPAEAAR